MQKLKVSDEVVVTAGKDKSKKGEVLNINFKTNKVLVKGGQRVTKGQVIGRMGDSGSKGQVHLHFEYWKSGRESDAVNPIKLLKRICPSI